MKKILALMLVVCLALGCFVGCKDDKDTTNTKKPTTTTAAPATTAPADDNADESATPDESVAPDESEAPSVEPSDEPSKDPVKETEAPAPAGDWEMPDNSDIDCLAIDFRNGADAYENVEDGYAYLLTGENAGSNNMVYLEAIDAEGATPGYLSIEFDGDDPFMYIYDFGDWELQDYPFVKIVMKNNTAVDGFEMFLFEQGGSCSGNVTISGISASDSAFKTYIIDLRASGASNTLSVNTNGFNMDKMFSAIRFDGPDAEGSFDIQYMGFFASLADAQAYK